MAGLENINQISINTYSLVERWRKYFPVTLPDFPLTISLPWHQDLPTRSEGRQQFVEAGFEVREGEQPNRLGLMEAAAKEFGFKR